MTAKRPSKTTQPSVDATRPISRRQRATGKSCEPSVHDDCNNQRWQRLSHSSPLAPAAGSSVIGGTSRQELVRANWHFSPHVLRRLYSTVLSVPGSTLVIGHHPPRLIVALLTSFGEMVRCRGACDSTVRCGANLCSAAFYYHLYFMAIL